MNNMSIKDRIGKSHKIKSAFCIAIGTGIGLITYIIFLRLNLAIFGWNLGLIFAPLVAGYVETKLANRIVGENIGAISAFILFIDTTIYSFILNNNSLGFNILTAGSILIILQSAFPTLVNYIIMVVLGGILANFINTIKKYEKKTLRFIEKYRPFHWEGKPVEEEPEILPTFDEKKSNKQINSLDFFFITSSDMENRKHRILRTYHSEIIIDKDKALIQTDPEKIEMHRLVSIKEAKDECLIKLAKKIKNDGGNGILDLSMTYSLIGNGGDSIQISAMGIGILLE